MYGLYVWPHFDASYWIKPLVFFNFPAAPRMLKAVDVIMGSPNEGGLGVEEGSS
jgi:hypothetical protein